MKTLEKTKADGVATSLPSPLTVCFVCTGNTCRSPMAAALLNDLCYVPPICSMMDVEKLVNTKKIRATSAGLFATGAPIAPHAIEALERAGVRSLPDNPYREHVSRPLDIETVEACDLIIGMTGTHVMHLMADFPAYASKIHGMPVDIPDPYGGDGATYDACLAAIARGIAEMFFPEEVNENGDF
jgi:protein-tyrosine phosphatase